MTKPKKRTQRASSASVNRETQPVAPQTLMDHIKELQVRLFIVAAAFLVAAAIAFPFFERIVDVIVKPLGSEHELVYLTPSGAFNFMIIVSIYVGVIGALPVIIYHTYRFIMPAVTVINIRRAIIYTITSLLLAAAGIVFAYIVMLPAAIGFLTGFDFYHINPMLTVDSYFSFVMTYIVVGAALFQLPLIMFIINTATPLNPQQLMSYQGKIILGSFIVAALVSPTPDAVNQTLLAMPIVVMYQIGIILIWIKNRKRKPKTVEVASVGRRTASPAPYIAPTRSLNQGTPQLSPPLAKTLAPRSEVSASATLRKRPPSMGGVYRVGAPPAKPLASQQKKVTSDNWQPQKVKQPQFAATRSVRMSPRSIDGFSFM